MSKDNMDSQTMINCEDIYTEEMEKSIRTITRFREAWINSSSAGSSELFQYADSDFYFYRFAIERQEKETEPLLIRIIKRAMERYNVSFECFENDKQAPFVFVINASKNRIGYRFSDFFCDEGINETLRVENVSEAIIIRVYKPGKSDLWLSRENEGYQRDGLRLRAISLRSFFEKYFCPEEYKSFETHIERYLKATRDITGYKSIKFLSSMNLANLKAYEEKVLIEWDYKNYSFNACEISSKASDANTQLSESVLKTMEKNYITNMRYKSMLGSHEYAKSFITSEWLYHSLKGKTNFDYTSVVSGYLKSIEQLLYSIVMLNIDNNCKITLNKSMAVDAQNNNVIAYSYNKKKGWQKTSYYKNGNKFIDFTKDHAKYMDRSLGTYEKFLEYNPHIFEDLNCADAVANIVGIFRSRYRNGFFHIHNLYDWDTVEKTRSMAIYLYFVLLGGCIIPVDKNDEFGITGEDPFNELCKKIREFMHYSTNFIFEYGDGRILNLVYDRNANTKNYTSDGIEYYESLLFIKVTDFSFESYKKLDEGISEDQKVLLTRKNLPYRIYGVHRDKRLEEITE